MLLSADVYGINTKYGTLKRRECNIKLHFQHQNNKKLIHNYLKAFLIVEKINEITLICNVLALEVSTTSLVSITPWRYNPRGKGKQANEFY